MKISPMASAAVPTLDQGSGTPQPSRVDSMRTLKMNTRATPLPNQQMFQNFQEEKRLPILSDNENDQTDATVEATQALSPQLALLAKQRRTLQREREAFNRERELHQRPSGNDAIDVSRLKSEPLRVLLENGVTYDQLTEAIMSNQGNSEFHELSSKLEALEKGIEEKFTKRDQQSEQQVLAEMRREADQMVVNGDDYELIRETRSVPKVMELIERTYRESGEVLDVSEALKLYEDELFNEYQKITKYKKIQSHISPMAQQQMQSQQRYNSGGIRTLTNRDTASVQMADKKQRAMAAFYGRPLK